ncbi:MAG: ATP-dependent 6-phosphofructokinase, partial [Spirochaetota bacterium]
DANFVLIPEVPFGLEGPSGFFQALKARLERRNHAVVIVAEGAGQEFFSPEETRDESGNRKLRDIGILLKNRICEYFGDIGMEVNLKYIDPSYIIRSAVAAPTDSLYCSRLGNNAAHAAMAGKTRIVISQVNNVFVHIPIPMCVSERNRVDPESSLWRDVIEATHQPLIMKNSP